MSSKRRPVIGVMTGHYLSDYPRTIISELWRSLKDMNVDLRLYSGVNANIVFSHRLAEIDDSKDIYEAYDEGFGLHWLSMFEYSHFDDVDLLIICYGNILASHPYNKTEDLLSLLPDVPKIILGTDLDMENVVCVTVDNYGSMKAGISHLIEEHNKKDIAFISGPKVSQSANRRMEAYLDALEEHGLPIRDSLIAFGDYLNNIDDIVEDLFSRNDNIDAIVSSNDEMCNAIYRVAGKLGRKIGSDLAVIGFDDAPFAATMNPPLTTIHQDYHIEADGAIRLVKDYLSGNKLSSTVIPAGLVIRESCGCHNIPGTPDNGNPAKKTYIQYEELYQTQIQNLSAAVTLRNLLLDSVNRKAFFETLAKEMIIADTPSSYVFLFDEPIYLEDSKDFVLPDTVRLFMRQEGQSFCAYNLEDAPTYDRHSVSSDISNANGSKMTASYLLFYRNYQYGTLIVETDPDNLRFYYTLSLQIGSALRYLTLALRQQKINRLLQEQNQILDFAAYHDQLTGLYNRAGVMQQMIKLIRENESTEFVAAMGDLDHLKQINDTFGHDAGDSAICMVSKVLKEAFPEGSALGRSGGDEFTGMFALTDDIDLDVIKSRIKAACDNYNETSGKPYYLGISVGFYVFTYCDKTDLSKMLKMADNELYEAKKLRRSNVVRD